MDMTTLSYFVENLVFYILRHLSSGLRPLDYDDPVII